MEELIVFQLKAGDELEEGVAMNTSEMHGSTSFAEDTMIAALKNMSLKRLQTINLALAQSISHHVGGVGPRYSAHSPPASAMDRATMILKFTQASISTKSSRRSAVPTQSLLAVQNMNLLQAKTLASLVGVGHLPSSAPTNTMEREAALWNIFKHIHSELGIPFRGEVEAISPDLLRTAALHRNIENHLEAEEIIQTVHTAEFQSIHSMKSIGKSASLKSYLSPARPMASSPPPRSTPTTKTRTLPASPPPGRMDHGAPPGRMDRDAPPRRRERDPAPFEDRRENPIIPVRKNSKVVEAPALISTVVDVPKRISEEQSKRGIDDLHKRGGREGSKESVPDRDTSLLDTTNRSSGAHHYYARPEYEPVCSTDTGAVATGKANDKLRTRASVDLREKDASGTYMPVRVKTKSGLPLHSLRYTVERSAHVLVSGDAGRFGVPTKCLGLYVTANPVDMHRLMALEVVRSEVVDGKLEVVAAWGAHIDRKLFKKCSRSGDKVMVNILVDVGYDGVEDTLSIVMPFLVFCAENGSSMRTAQPSQPLFASHWEVGLRVDGATARMVSVASRR